MRTAAVIHEVTCKCGNVALVTIPHLGNVKGFCVDHLNDIRTDTHLTDSDILAILRTLTNK